MQKKVDEYKKKMKGSEVVWIGQYSCDGNGAPEIMETIYEKDDSNDKSE